jgi:hypothetical protein
MAKKRSGTGPADGQPDATSATDDSAVDDGTVDDSAFDHDDVATDDGDHAGADDGGDDDGAGDDDGVPSNGRPSPPGWTTGWQRLSKTFLTPVAPKSSPRQKAPVQPHPDFSTMTDAQKRNLVNQIDPTERKIGYAASALAVVLTLVANIPYMVSRVSVATTTKPNGHTCADHYTYTTNGAGKAATCNTIYPASHYAFYLVVLLVFSVAIFVTVRIGRRAPLAFTMVLTGLALGSFIANTIIVLPFIVAGGWLLLRAWRSQKYGSPSAKAPLPGYTPAMRGPAPKTGTASGRPSASTTNASRRSRKGQPTPTTATGRSAPTANKRYTPKAPPRKKIPPSTDRPPAG